MDRPTEFRTKMRNLYIMRTMARQVDGGMPECQATLGIRIALVPDGVAIQAADTIQAIQARPIRE